MTIVEIGYGCTGSEMWMQGTYLSKLEAHQLQQLGLQELTAEGEPMHFPEGLCGSRLVDFHRKGDQ